MADDQAATVRTITSYRIQISSLIDEHRGRVVDAPGDNVLAEFPTALDAVQAAVEIQRVLAARNQQLPDARRMLFRIGVHLGDITVESGRLYGDGVNVAARIEAIAQPGGICVSGAVEEQLRQQSDFRCTDLGAKSLKNIPAPVRVFRVHFEGQVHVAKPPASRVGGSRLSWFVALAASVVAAALAVQLSRYVARPVGDTSAPVSRWSIAVPDDSRLGLPARGGRFDYSRLIAVSRDGQRIAYTQQDARKESLLYVRAMDAVEARPIPGTENGRAPFFSPDGRWLGFLAGEVLQKVALGGGAPQTICAVDRVVGFDAGWSPDGETIVFATDDGLWLVAASGGTPEQVTAPNSKAGEVGHHSPRFTADGRAVLFTVSVTPKTHVALLSLSSGEWRTVVSDASQGVEVDGDRILFARAGELLIAPFAQGQDGVFPSAVSVIQGIHTSPGLGGVVVTHFDVSDNGILASIPSPGAPPPDQLLWVDHDGGESVVTSGAGTWVHPRLAPNGERISVDIHSPDGMRDVYIYELSRRQLRQLTQSGTTWESEWRPDGQRIAIMSGAPVGHWSLFWTSADFSGTPELLVRSSHAVPTAWAPDGRSLLFYDLVEHGIWRLAPGTGEDPELLMRTQARERFPTVSPNGKWIAYVADESHRREVFVQSFPGLGAKHQISSDGGGEPLWSPDGRNLYFRERGQMLVVDVTYEPAFHTSRPRVLFVSDHDAALSGHQHYSISRDGKRFLMITHGTVTGPRQIHVALNWLGDL